MTAHYAAEIVRLRLLPNVAALIATIVAAIMPFKLLGQEDPCIRSVKPITSHPDRPYPRGDTAKAIFDWRSNEWPVFVGWSPSRFVTDTVRSIPSPHSPMASVYGALVDDNRFMDPELGWELLIAKNGLNIDPRLFGDSPPSYLFTNKYDGRLRALNYSFPRHNVTSVRWEISSGSRSLNAIFDPLSIPAVDSNLWTGTIMSFQRRLPQPLPSTKPSWFIWDFTALYDPCTCQRDERDNLFVSLSVITERDTVVGGQSGIVSRSYFAMEVGSRQPGRDRSTVPANSSLIPAYDVPLGTWTLLSNPVVALSSFSRPSSTSPRQNVMVTAMLDEPLVQTINYHVFEEDPQTPNRLVYIIPIYGNIESTSRLVRLNDTLFMSEEVDALCATAEPVHMEFIANGGYEIGPLRVMLAPTLRPRDGTGNVSTTSPWLSFSTRTRLVRSIQPSTTCNGIRQATTEEIAHACEKALHPHWSVRRGPAMLPVMDTVASVSSPTIAVSRPATNRADINVTMEPGDIITNITVVNIMGQVEHLVPQFHVNSFDTRISFNFDTLSSGIYFVHVQTLRSRVVERIIVQHE